jgi:hypothetical protein
VRVDAVQVVDSAAVDVVRYRRVSRLGGFHVVVPILFQIRSQLYV